MKKTFDNPIEFNEIGKNIIHIRMKDKNSLAKAMFRMQESYESPFDEIRGKVFTLGFIKSLGSRGNSGVNTYCGGNNFEADWSGYNFPSYVLDPFIKGLFDPLTNEEQDIVEVLRYKQGKFYVIGTYGDDDPAQALEHEIRHAMYYVCDEYKKEVDKVLKQYKKTLEPFKKCLLYWGYGENVLDDECHAYISADYEVFDEEYGDDFKKFKVNIPKRLHDRLNCIYKKYKKKIEILGWSY